MEALLLESEASFAIDAGVLIKLADAEVPGVGRRPWESRQFLKIY